MNKPYDRVGWSYLERVMTMMGFQPSLVSLIMGCVSIASFSVLINGVPKGHITPTCGLRQGDPPSPYLFLLCTEGLVCLLKKAMVENQVQGMKVCRGAPSMNHLLSIDESIIFYKVDLPTN